MVNYSRIKIQLEKQLPEGWILLTNYAQQHKIDSRKVYQRLGSTGLFRFYKRIGRRGRFMVRADLPTALFQPDIKLAYKAAAEYEQMKASSG